MLAISFPIHPGLLYQPPCVRREVRAALAFAGFPSNVSKQCEDILVSQIRYSRIFRKAPTSTQFKNQDDALNHFDWEDFVWSPGRGRADQSHVRHHLMATLFRVWVLAFGKVPTTNNKGYARTPFMQFANLILRREGIGKLVPHMERFRSVRKAALATL